ncbi:VC0807 family protein [Pseudonocardia sp. TRM90224]|uniref:VC0807 family protein n=1 Tax=Pseudonocardia sp. TRM90224 TaxID=2812678 RepID=UPI001E310E2C|nr:VC0807 family protein [Pseudonocardia sp. TRM90224]
MIASEHRSEAVAGEEKPVNPVRMMMRGLAFDVGLPVVTYYALHLLGADDWVALLAASGIAATRIVWSAVQERKLNQFATVMLLVYGLGFALAFVTGDPRTLLLKSSFVTGAVGLLFLASAIHGKQPLTLSAAQSFMPRKSAELAELYRVEPKARNHFRISSTVWGVGLLTEAIVRIPLVYLLPIEIAYGVTEGMFVATFVVLMVWNGWYVRRTGFKQD